MNKTTLNFANRRRGNLYRDRENGWIFGVCAGLADGFGISALAVRAVTALCLILFSLPTALLYGAAALLMRSKPLVYSGHRQEYEFWKCGQDNGGRQ